MTGLAAHEVFFMVTIEAELDIRFRQGRYFTGSRVCRMRLMAAHAIRDIFLIMGYVTVGRNLFPACCDEAGRCRSEFFERTMTFQADRRCTFIFLCRRSRLGNGCGRECIQNHEKDERNHDPLKPMPFHEVSPERKRRLYPNRCPALCRKVK